LIIFRCSSSYWVMYFIYLPIAIWITLIYSNKVLSQYKYRKSINYAYHESDVKWTTEIILKYPIYSFFGGMMAGLLGIGGGLIFGPLLLDLGLNPIVSTATSNFLVLFTSSSTSLQFILQGTMNFHYGFVCTICSTLGSYLGTIAIQRLINKTGRASILIFSMALVEAISSVCIPMHAYFEMRRGVSQGADIWSFSSPC
jgi:uncharacterized membrane protein YfcA